MSFGVLGSRFMITVFCVADWGPAYYSLFYFDSVKG